MSIRPRVIVTSLIVIAAAVLAYRSFNATGSQRLDQSSFNDAVMEGRVMEVTMVSDGIGFEIRGTLSSEHTYTDDRPVERFTTYVLAEPNLLETLSDNGVSVKAEPPRRESFLRLLGPWIFLLIIGAVFVFFMRRMQQGGGQVLSLRRSRAKLSSRTGKITFKDVAGVPFFSGSNFPGSPVIRPILLLATRNPIRRASSYAQATPSMLRHRFPLQ